MDDEERYRTAASRLLGVCASGLTAPLPSLNAMSASVLLRHVCTAISARNLDDSEAVAVSLAVKYGQHDRCKRCSYYSLPVQMRAQSYQHDRERMQVLDCLSDPPPTHTETYNHLNHTGLLQC